VCDDQTDHEYYTETPTIIVEVLSESTRRYDKTIKRLAYQSISTLQEYILIEPTFRIAKEIIINGIITQSGV
jgi:Uma2 family endonuclease